MSNKKEKVHAASLKRRKWGLGFPIHIQILLILINIGYYIILVLNKLLNINYIDCLLYIYIYIYVLMNCLVIAYWLQLGRAVAPKQWRLGGGLRNVPRGSAACDCCCRNVTECTHRRDLLNSPRENLCKGPRRHLFDRESIGNPYNWYIGS